MAEADAQLNKEFAVTQQQNKQGIEVPSVKDGMNVLYLGALIMATCFTPVTRRDFGRECSG